LGIKKVIDRPLIKEYSKAIIWYFLITPFYVTRNLVPPLRLGGLARNIFPNLGAHQTVGNKKIRPPKTGPDIDTLILIQSDSGPALRDGMTEGENYFSGTGAPAGATDNAPNFFS